MEIKTARRLQEFTYLGLPLGAKYKSNAVWRRVEDIYERRLATWKTKFLSKGGRLQLVKATLSAIPIYFLSLVTISRKMARRLETIQRNFLWCGNEEKSKCNLIAWDKLKWPKERGGLGIRDLSTFNMALKAKWLWRYLNETDGLWKEVINCKYGNGSERDIPNLNIRGHGRGFWKGIVDLWPDFRGNIVWMVGDGSKSSFWLIDWCTETVFRDLFPRLFRIASDPHIMVKNQMEGFGIDAGLNLGLKRQPYAWEEEERDALTRILCEIGMKIEATDHWRWSTPNGQFTVADFYNKLRGSVGVEFPYLIVWKSGAPAKVCFFAWEAAWNGILTGDIMRRRGFTLVNRCYLCKCAEETTDHLLLHCKISS